jgi:hypothetical protein
MSIITECIKDSPIRVESFTVNSVNWPIETTDRSKLAPLKCYEVIAKFTDGHSIKIKNIKPEDISFE